MDRESAIKYLKRKGKPQTQEEIDNVCKNGKVYGDPLVILE